MTTPTRPIEYRHVAVRMTQAIAAQLRGGIAVCQLSGVPVTDQMDLDLLPVWKVPQSWSNYSVHLLDLQQSSTSLFNSTTQRWTINSNATVLSSTDNGVPYTVTDYWATHPEYDSNDDTHTLNAFFVLVLTGSLGNGPSSGTEQVFSVVGVQRIPFVTNTVVQSLTITPDRPPTPPAQP